MIMHESSKVLGAGKIPNDAVGVPSLRELGPR